MREVAKSVEPSKPAKSKKKNKTACRPGIRTIDAIRKSYKLKHFQKWRQIAVVVRQDIWSYGYFFNTPQGYFIFDSEYRRAFPLQKGNVALAALVEKRYGINATEREFKELLASLQSEAHLRGKQVEIRRLAHYDRVSYRLYVSRFDGNMYRLDGNLVELIPNGSDGVFFFDNPAWHPYEYLNEPPEGQLDKMLIESANFADDGALSVTEQRLLLKLWLLAVFFSSLHPTKILLLLLGEKGGGKSTSLRRIVILIFGPKAQLYSLEGSKADGFVAAVTSEPLVMFDNVDERISWLPDALARLATGTEFPRRQLYTTNEMVSFKGDCWLGLNARTAKFMESRDDLPDRTLVLRTKRIESFVGESELLADVAQHRDELWSELMDELQAIVRHLRESRDQSTVRFRMADFASFALQVGTLWGCRDVVNSIFAKLEEEQSELIFEDDPICQALELWLANKENCGRLVDSATLQRELSFLAEENRIRWPYKNGRSLGQRLSHVLPNLRQKFEVNVETDSARQHLYRFCPNAESLKRGKPQFEEIQTAK